MPDPSGVHLVGSLPFKSDEEAFTQVCKLLRNRLATIPDGETGSRNQFTIWQGSCFPQEIRARYFSNFEPPANQDFECKLEDIKPTQYDAVAAASYQKLRQLRDEGIIPQGVRFQVSLPCILSVTHTHVDARYLAQVTPLYEQRYLEDIARLQKLIPLGELAVQFDLAAEMAVIEHSRGNVPPGLPPSYAKPYWPADEDSFKAVTDVAIRLAKAVNPDVPLGFHLCYGDIENRHWMEPKDLGLLTDVANSLVEGLKPFRSVSCIHMPCPKDRTDLAYYEPLNKLSFGTDTKLFLGLVHAHDEQGTRGRIAAAQKFYGGSFGVATECGMGRTPSEKIDSIFGISAAVSAPITL